jgi:uncharacterized membrane protein
MLAAAPDPDDVDRRFVVSPNRSLSWQGNCLFIALVGLVLFLVASGFVLAGLWVVAPFAGLELLAVGIALHAVHRRGRRTEIIDVSAPSVIISVAGSRPERRFRLPRGQSRVILNAAARQGHPSRLFISSPDLGVEIGRCLGEEERQGLAAALRAAIHALPGSLPAGSRRGSPNQEKHIAVNHQLS